MQYFTEKNQFFGNTSPEALLERFGSPLYVYNEAILRKRARDMAHLVDYAPFWADYSCKANTNLALLRIIHEEGIHADAMSPGEIFALLRAGYAPEEILFVCNNVSVEEMAYAEERGVLMSADSVSQLETFGKAFPHHNVAIRLNPGIGVGHHARVVTAGKATKFGINPEEIPQVKEICRRYDLTIVGLNQHLGSLFMDPNVFMPGVEALLKLAMEFPGLSFIDLGGGFGIPYRKQEGEANLPLEPLKRMMEAAMEKFVAEYKSRVTFRIEPGRYIVAECGVLLGRVHATKNNTGVRYVGCDIGFNVLQRPIMYDSHHEIEVFRGDTLVKGGPVEEVTIVGNICESGDKLVHGRVLPQIREGDILAVMDAGAYGYSMASNYNHRARPAEVLIREDGSACLVRRRDTLEELIAGCEEIE